MNATKPTGGWIALYRQSFDNELYFAERFTRWQAWVDILLLANHKDRVIVLRGRRYEVKRGQCAYSIQHLAIRWKWNWRTVKRHLRYMEVQGMIHSQSTPDTTIITVLNYDNYQGGAEPMVDESAVQSAERSAERSADKQEGYKKVEEPKKEDSTVKRQTAATFKELLEQEDCIRLYDEEFALFVRGVRVYCASAGFDWTPRTASVDGDLRVLVYKWKDDEKARFMQNASNALGHKVNWPLFLFRAIQHMIASTRKQRVKFPLLWLQSVMMKNPMQLISSAADGPLSRIQFKV